MPHVSPLKTNDAPEKSQTILKAIEEKFGQSLNIFSTAAYQPDVLGGMTQVNDGIQNDLPDKFRELAYLKVSKINQCEYCSTHHAKAAKKAGVTDTQLAKIDNFAETDGFDAQEKAVLSYADQLTRTATVEAGIVQSLKAFLNDKQLVTLAATVALANFTNRFNHGLDIELP